MGTYEIFGNLVQTLTSEDRVSIQKHAGSRGAAPVGGLGIEKMHDSGGMC